MNTKKKADEARKRYQVRLDQVQDLAARIDGIAEDPTKFVAKQTDLEVLRYCLSQTEGLLEILIKEDFE